MPVSFLFLFVTQRMSNTLQVTKSNPMDTLSIKQHEPIRGTAKAQVLPTTLSSWKWALRVDGHTVHQARRVCKKYSQSTSTTRCPFKLEAGFTSRWTHCPSNTINYSKERRFPFLSPAKSLFALLALTRK